MKKWNKIVKGHLYTHPKPFDLVKIKNSEEKTFVGWWTGYFWDGQKSSEFDSIVEWQPIN